MIVRRMFAALASGALLLAAPAVAAAAPSEANSPAAEADWYTVAYYEATGSGWEECHEDGDRYVFFEIGEDYDCEFVQTEANAYVVLSLWR